MILATFFMGATFPVGVGLYSNRMRVLGRSIGSIYSVNTVGAIFGSLAAGFLLVPVIGTERTILTGVFLNSALAVLLLAESRGSMARARWAAIGLLIVSTVSIRGERCSGIQVHWIEAFLSTRASSKAVRDSGCRNTTPTRMSFISRRERTRIYRCGEAPTTSV